MITAIDTNVLFDVLAPDPQYFERSVQAIEEAAQAGSLVICDLVYAELCVHFPRQTDCDEFLEQNDIRIEPLTREASFLASRLWRTYRQEGGKRTRILTDFLVGAHAKIQASQLLTRDRGFYREIFRSLSLVDPANPSRRPRTT
ncbi:MAG: type II toxin-antitoxin system VapC family toxin [Acidobacteriota bacterium]|nr:type II toxin-antitoxin system VapC family toxin [Acidobacteriota bacterium]